MKTIVKTRPRFNDFPSIFDELFFNDSFGRKAFHKTGLPAVNVKENDNAFALEIAIPGYKKEDIKINIENDVLNISAEISESKEESTEGYTRKEFKTESFSRSFTLPENIDTEQIKASTTDGVLNIELPKVKEIENNTVKVIDIQ